jgi:hypothetical protein
MIGLSLCCNSINHSAAITKVGPVSYGFGYGGKLDASAARGIASAHGGKVNGIGKAVRLVAVEIVHKIAPSFDRHIASTIQGKMKVCNASR